LSRRWKLTPLGERFLAAPAPLQVWLLLATWWTQTNWAIASPYDFEDGYMPPGFSRLALKHLLELPLGEPASFERFADRMIEDSRMVWSTDNQDSARRILRSIIERTVINPLVDFGILQQNMSRTRRLVRNFVSFPPSRSPLSAKDSWKRSMVRMKPDQP
jgi:hypothetical protein